MVHVAPFRAALSNRLASPVLVLRSPVQMGLMAESGLCRRMFRLLAWREGGVLRSFKDSGKCGWVLRVGTGTGIDRKEIIFFQKRWTS